ncbi:MAG: serine/threonine protein kinase [Gammaproteobacteria bacterium]|jgi:Ser/Thr protein kinase RdoA (MazF antagonist)
MNPTPRNDAPAGDYAQLTPDVLLDAVDRCGYRSSGQLLALNSYENRVYRIGLEDGPPLVAKFYRPGRWSTPAILEEHDFARELATQEIPVVAPLVSNDATLQEYAGYRFALYPCQGGGWPELARREERAWMGRFIGRIHAVGATRLFEHRPVLTVDNLGARSVRFLLEQRFLPAHIETAYRTLTADLLQQVNGCFAAAGNGTTLRLHGDCHPGNVLWTQQGPHFVDLDDCQNGPAIQDLWMLISGERHEMQRQLADLLEGYRQFHEFDERELVLIEALRTLRMIHYAAWLARRLEDPAFPRAFPWFNTPRYWEEHILALREQSSLMQEAPLSI